jgi:signal transduction histidine kinase
MLERLVGEDINILSTRRSPGLVLADYSHIEQILMNLAVNARDAMPVGGTIKIATGNVNLDKNMQSIIRRLCLGPMSCCLSPTRGMASTNNYCRRSFEPFFTTKESGKGTGLGLATVYGL